MSNPRPKHDAPLDELAAWCIANNHGVWDDGDFPATDDLTNEEAQAAREEYESMADEIENNLQTRT
jgi:hypothetical protein